MALLVGVLVAGCTSGGPATPASTPGTTEPAPAVEAVELAETRWQAVELGGSPLVEGSTVTAAFGADGSLSGSGGCNRYRTTFTASGATIEISEAVASTMMACDQAVMEQESAYFAALGAARSFSGSAEDLTLADEAGAPLVIFDVQVQELAGTWNVTGYHDGGSAVVSPVQGSTPTLTFGADGAVSGTAGCNQLTGSVEVDGNSVTFGPLGSTMMHCDEPAGVMDQETRLIAALESAESFTLEGNRLEFRRGDAVMAATLMRG